MSQEPRVPENWDYTLRFPQDPLAPRIARRTLRLILEEYGACELVYRAELLTSELVANTYRHAEGPGSVRVLRSDNRVRFSVCDTNPVFPVLSPGWESRVDAEQGRGLGLVDLMADAWGGIIGDGLSGGRGKTIWFELGHESGS